MKKYIEQMDLTEIEKEAALYPGVTYSHKYKRWIASSKNGGIKKFLGHFSDPFSAQKAVITYEKTQPPKAKKSLSGSYTHIVRNTHISSSGYRGVCYRKRYNRWEANITFRGRRIYLGTFDNIEDAIVARNQAEAELFAPFVHKFEELYPQYSRA